MYVGSLLNLRQNNGFDRSHKSSISVVVSLAVCDSITTEFKNISKAVHTIFMLKV